MTIMYSVIDYEATQRLHNNSDYDWFESKKEAVAAAREMIAEGSECVMITKCDENGDVYDDDAEEYWTAEDFDDLAE